MTMVIGKIGKLGEITRLSKSMSRVRKSLIKEQDTAFHKPLGPNFSSSSSLDKKKNVMHKNTAFLRELRGFTIVSDFAAAAWRHTYELHKYLPLVPVPLMQVECGTTMIPLSRSECEILLCSDPNAHANYWTATTPVGSRSLSAIVSMSLPSNHEGEQIGGAFQPTNVRALCENNVKEFIVKDVKKSTMLHNLERKRPSFHFERPLFRC